MKYIWFLVLALMSWSSWGLTFTCKSSQDSGEERVQKLQWEMQNYQDYSNDYKAGTHFDLAVCQMENGKSYSDPQTALANFRIASDEFGDILSNYLLARYLLSGGWGQNTAAKNRDEAIWEFEKTLGKINAVFADYPNTDWMAEAELSTQMYPGTLIRVIDALTNKYLAEGYAFYEKTSPTYYDDPGKAIRRDQTNRDILSKLESHIESCLADHEGQNMMTRARRFDYIENFDQILAVYNAYYHKVKNSYCPHYKTLLVEIKERERAMHAIALNCTPPPQAPTEQRPSCADIKKETKEFVTYFMEEWLPRKRTIQGD